VPVDFTSIVEAIYRLETDEAGWLTGIADAAGAALDRGHGFWAILYDAPAPGRAVVHRLIDDGVAPGFASGAVARLLAEAPRSAPSCTLVSELPVGERALEAARATGIADVFGVHGASPCEGGIYLGVNLPRKRRLTPAARTRWTRVAVHLGAAYRLRRRIARDDAARIDAVLTPDGSIVEATPRATPRAARRALRDAVVSIDRARTLHRRRPDAALADWQGLVDGTWTLLDHFENDGRRFVLARSNEPVGPQIDALSARERQVCAFACLGHSNKLIAYELGLATSTVGVLLSRAMAKLGVRGRKALIAALGAENQVWSPR
jgi:DNA-binding CsgD family transcriptional regulator